MLSLKAQNILVLEDETEKQRDREREGEGEQEQEGEKEKEGERGRGRERERERERERCKVWLLVANKLFNSRVSILWPICHHYECKQWRNGLWLGLEQLLRAPDL